LVLQIGICGLFLTLLAPSVNAADQANILIQSIQFSSPDLTGIHKAELFTSSTKIHQNLTLKIDNKTVQQNIYWNSKIMLGDVDDDRFNEIFLYEYSVGSAGAMGLTVFGRVHNQWNRIFIDPRINEEGLEQRFSNKYLGKNQMQFYDNLTQLSGKLDMSRYEYSQEQLKKMRLQMDPISEYIIHYENIGCQIETMRWIFANSHPTSVLSVHDYYQYRFREHSFSLYETKILENDTVLGVKKYVLNES
jgi:hypothetical protein